MIDGDTGPAGHESQAGQEAEAGPRPGAARLALLAGSVTALVTATLLGSALALTSKWACRAGAWNGYLSQFQAHCYTDIYPLYFGEGLSSGKVPYADHPVEYPVLIGGAMQLVAWLVRPISNPFTRGREFFDLTVVLLTAFAVVGVLATAYLAGRSRRWTALGVALAPAVILAAYINWDLIAMGLAMAGMAAWAARRGVLAGVLLGLAVATKFYPLLFFGPLLLLCLRAGRMRQFWITFGSAAAAWLVVDLPVMIVAPAGWARFYELSDTRSADWGSILVLLRDRALAGVGTTSVGTLNVISAGVFLVACVLIVALTLGAPQRPRVAQLFFLTLARSCCPTRSGRRVRGLASPPGRAGPSAPRRLPGLAGGGGGLLLRDLGLPDHGVGGRALVRRGRRHRYRAVLHRAHRPVRHRRAAVRPGGPGLLQPAHDVVPAGGADDPAGGVLSGAADRLVLRPGPRRSTQPAAAATSR